MKKLFLILLTVIMISTLLLPLVACNNEEEEDVGTAGSFTIYNCEDYIDEEIFPEFEAWYYEKYGKRVTVNYVTYDTNETMLTKVLNNDANVDVICTSEYAIQKLYNNDMLYPIDKTEGMNTINQGIYTMVEKKFGEDFSNYLVPYMYGTLGILYNADIFEEYGINIEEEGWSILWNPNNHEILNKMILMKDSIRDTFAAGVLYLKEQNKLPEGYGDYSVEDLINCTEKELVDAVSDALIDQKTALKKYEVDFGKDDLVALKAYVDLAWSGDAMYAIEEAELYDVNLDYYVPDAGANVWFDGWFIPKCTTKRDVANAWIEFCSIPSISARNMIYVGYSSAVDKEILQEDEEVLALLEENEYDVEEFFSWDVRYPDISNPDFGMMADYGDANTRMTIMWETVKAATPKGSMPLWSITLICFGIIIGAFGIACGIYFLVGRLKLKRRID